MKVTEKEIMKLFLISLFLFLGFLAYFYMHGHSKNSAIKIDLSKEDIETLDSINNSDQHNTHERLAKPISLIKQMQGHSKAKITTPMKMQIIRQ
jgi:hypothetical protein